MNNKTLILFGIGFTILALIKIISYMVEKIKQLFHSIPLVYKEAFNDPDRASKIKKYIEQKIKEKRGLKGDASIYSNIEIDIDTMKEAGLGDLKNTIPQIFYSFISIMLIIVIIYVLFYLYSLQTT